MVWPALILAPLVALGNLSLTYALVTPSCALQTRWILHVPPVASVVIIALFTALAFRQLAATHAGTSDSGTPLARQHFVASVAVLLGTLSAFVVLAQWLPQWLLSPCAT